VQNVSELETHIEAIVAHRQEGYDPTVERWFAARALRTEPMRVGVLVSGTVRAFEAAFGVDVELGERPISLPVPAELAQAVESITIPARPQIHT
jgi:hypothetical protein